MWHETVPCRDYGDLFITPGNTARKKAICATCPSINECLSEAMRNQDYNEIVWGGMTGVERKQLSKGTVW